MFKKLKGNSPETSVGETSASSTALPTSASRGRLLPTSVPGVLSQAQKPAIVSEQFTIRGDIESDGTLHVEGQVIGLVKAHTIHIGSTGRIEGDVICENLNVKGQIDGKVVCQDLTIAATAMLQGQVTYRFITVGSGARVHCDMTVQTS